MTGVDGFRWQSTEPRKQLFPFQHSGLLRRQSLEHLCKQRSARDGCYASFGTKAGFCDFCAVNLEAELQNVAASGIFDLGCCGRCQQFAGVARILEMS